LSALIIILRSTGPVISVRRSCRSAGAESPRLLRRRTNRSCAPCRHPGGEQALAFRIQLTVEAIDERERLCREKRLSLRELLFLRGAVEARVEESLDTACITLSSIRTDLALVLGAV